ncbi:Spy/CpxP family protein refolding chaperone [Humitalea sp. 24SJ18S-53]|uniref:Spy/CpxP family protein refolding chaperone n=1 Tax=Humitalea sp. 24SJ18S-53 TaxID=3422307 RepID=UPI003D66FC3A
MRSFSPARLATLIIGLSLPLGAMAQGTPPPDAAAAAEATPPAVTRPASRHRPAAATPEQMRQSMERYLTQLRTQLAVTPAQQPQWDQFAQVSRANATELQDRFAQRGTRLGRMSAAENMQDYAQISELQAQQLQRLATAFQALYDAMSPDQQRGADAVFRVNRPPTAPRNAARRG